MTRSARAAALRSTALATSLALAVAPGRLRGRSRAKPKVPCRSRGRSRATSFPRTAPSTCRASRAAAPAPRSRLAPRDAASPRAAAAAAAQAVGAGRDRRDVVDLAGRYRGAGKRHRAGAQAASRRMRPQAQAAISDPVARKLAEWVDPAQRRQRRVGRALSRVSSAPIRAGPRRPSCAGASRRRCGTTAATTPRSGPSSKTNRRSRPRASSRWRARCSRAATAPMPSVWCATPGATIDLGGHRECALDLFGALLTPGDHKARMDCAALRQRARGRAARRQAARRQSGGDREGAHRGQQDKAAQRQGAARRGARRIAQRPRLHLQPGSSCCAATTSSPRPRS